MIFVTLGTHEQPFVRALDLMAELDGDDEVLIQHGATPARADLRNGKWVEYLESDALTARMNSAEVVISHAGVGSMITAIRAGVKPVVVPRLARFGEHVDDHQLQLAERFAERELVLVCRPGDSLREIVAAARESRPPVLSSAGQAGLGRAVAEAALGRKGLEEEAMPLGSEPLRVALLLSTRYFEDFYGAGLALTRRGYLDGYRNDWSWDWCRMLAREGVHTIIYVPTIEEAERVTTTDGYGVRFLPLGPAAAPWVRFPILERSPVGRYVGQVANTAAFLAPLRSALLTDQVDVLCVQEYWTARFDVISRALDHPVVGVDQGLPDRHEMKLLKRGSFGHSAGVVVQTEREAAKVARYGGQARRIPNAVDTRLFCPGADDNESDDVVLCVGRLHNAQKRFSDVIRALVLLPAEWRLEIAGTGPDRHALERLSGELGVSNRVKFLGFVSDSEQLRDLYRRTSVLALPSAYEGLPMVLLEAMSCGMPVVGSDIPAIAEVVEPGRTGLLIPVGAPDRLAEALCEAVARGTELGTAARESILTSYDQAVVGPRLVEMLCLARLTAPRAW